jgi:hypothetical protein
MQDALMKEGFVPENELSFIQELALEIEHV